MRMGQYPLEQQVFANSLSGKVRKGCRVYDGKCIMKSFVKVRLVKPFVAEKALLSTHSVFVEELLFRFLGFFVGEDCCYEGRRRRAVVSRGSLFFLTFVLLPLTAEVLKIAIALRNFSLAIALRNF